ncbi:hypothetical protein JXB28_01390 [Candidatus Woesearchaeota archaeon]|nr:hypothetical protein [Candidatus Woesearchaeota archaeon]
MPTKNILEEFFDKKTLSILKLFLFDDTKQFYLREIAKKAKVPVSSTFRIVKRLKAMGLVSETIIKKTKLYSLAVSKDSAYLSKLLEEKKGVIEEFVDYVSKLPGVDMIVMHGEEAKDKANIIVIGAAVDSKAVKEKVGEIKGKYNFNIIEYVLDPGVFNQMSQGGLISGRKVILWEKPA